MPPVGNFPLTVAPPIAHDAEAMSNQSSLPLAAFIDGGAHLGDEAWSDRFLELGGRLQPLYGAEIQLDELTPAYEVFVGSVLVLISTAGADGPGCVRVSALVSDDHQTATIEWALRRNRTLSMAHLALVGAGLVATYDIPFATARASVLAAAISNVAAATRTIRRELEATPLARQSAASKLVR